MAAGSATLYTLVEDAAFFVQGNINKEVTTGTQVVQSGIIILSLLPFPRQKLDTVYMKLISNAAFRLNRIFFVQGLQIECGSLYNSRVHVHCMSRKLHNVKKRDAIYVWFLQASLRLRNITVHALIFLTVVKVKCGAETEWRHMRHGCVSVLLVPFFLCVCYTKV